jgi:hypothetical protein
MALLLEKLIQIKIHQQFFHEVAGGRQPPQERARELWAIVGLRGGKSRIAAAIAVYLPCFVKHHLAHGETGYVLVLALSRDQAGVTRSPSAEQSSTATGDRGFNAHEIRLRNGLVIAIHANSFRSVRGRTLVACIFDESAFWRSEESTLARSSPH